MKTFQPTAVALAISIALINAASAQLSDSNKTSLGAVEKKETLLFDKSLTSEGSDNVPIWRIPSLVNTKDGVLIAAIDKRWQHRGDWGDIDIAVRTSKDNGKTWSPINTILNLVSRNPANSPMPADPPKFNPWGVRRSNPEYRNSAFVMDSVMVEDKINGKVILAIDMFPESTGLSSTGDNGVSAYGSGYIKINGKYYQKLLHNSKQWTVRENGEVFDEHNQKTNYKMITQGNPDLDFKDLGDVYDITNNRKLGNAYLSKEGNNSNVPFTIEKTSYLWITTSNDNGTTWSNPIDITPQVKKDWMRFFGSGPGVGIQTKSGSLLLPIYYINRHGKQSSALIISKDGGKTWDLGQSPNDSRTNLDGHNSETLTWHGYRNTIAESQGWELTESQLVELENGHIKLFMRNRSGRVIMSTSKDGGYTWVDTKKLNELTHGYSQISIIKFSKKIDGKEYLLFSGQSEQGNGGDNLRRNGKLLLGEVSTDGNITWKPATLVRNITSTGKANGNLANGYVYSSMAELNDGSIGLAYENTTDYTTVMYLPIDLQEFFWKEHKIFSDSRRETPLEITYNSQDSNETFYKIGDGEMLKVGEGINNSNLKIIEGIATLAQSADSTNKKQAFNNVYVEEAGTLKITSADQINLNNLHLNNGTFDLNGQNISFNSSSRPTTDNAESNKLNVNIINGNTTTPATLTYELSGEQKFFGKLGNETGQLNFIYRPTAQTVFRSVSQPTSDNNTNSLTLNGDSILNQLELQNGNLKYAENSIHRINELNLGSNANLYVGSNTSTNINTALINGDLSIDTNKGQTSTLSINSTGSGQLTKSGNGLLKLNGNLAHTGATTINAGETQLTGSLSEGNLEIHSGATFGGEANITADTTLKQGSTIMPGVGDNENSFTGKTLSLNNVVAQGARVKLRINNNDADITNWKHDRLLITGNIQSENKMPIDLQFLGTLKNNTDTNQNGKYDVEEGISLIQVKGETKLEQFTLGKTLDQLNQDTNLFLYTLVGIDRYLSPATANAFNTNDNNFIDYRLQTLLVDKEGNNPEPFIRNYANIPEGELTEKEIALLTSLYKATTAENELLTLGQFRAQVNPVVPSYLVAQNALYQQGENIRQQFFNNIDSQNSKYFYVTQTHNSTKYTSDLEFRNYNYGYKTVQNSTLFGGSIPISNYCHLHSAIAFNSSNVSPQAVDGLSQAKYKSTSFFLGLQNKWKNNLILNAMLGYHLHRGKISTPMNDNVARVKGKQLQIAANIGYEIPFGNIRFIPTVGVSYQQLKTNVNTQMDNWHINIKPYNVFSQYIGAYLSWQNDYARLNVGTFYENNNATGKPVTIKANQSALFKQGDLGNALHFKVTSEIKITSNLSLELKLEHRKNLTKAKLRQDTFGGKLEYRF